MPNDSTVCTSLDNVKKTALRIQRLEAEKKLAIHKAATAEVATKKQQKAIKKLEHKLFWNKALKPIKQTAIGLGGAILGFVVGVLKN